MEKIIETITSGSTQEVIGLEEIKSALSERQLNAYWGTAPTKSPSIAYLIPLLKIRDLVATGSFNFTIFLADVHSFLDKGAGDEKGTWIDRTEQRTVYYEFLIRELLLLLNTDMSYITFTKGSEVQFTHTYILDLLKLLTQMTVTQATKASSDVVKQTKGNIYLSSLVYPLMQIIDESALEADVELGGVDQRKIFMASRDFSEKIGKKKCSYIMNGMLPSLNFRNKGKMSSSDKFGKLEFTDDEKTIREKIQKAYCIERTRKNNPCIALVEFIVFPLNVKLGPYDTFVMFIEDWAAGVIDAIQFKNWLAIALETIIAPIRQKIENNKNLYEAAFS